MPRAKGPSRPGFSSSTAPVPKPDTHTTYPAFIGNSPGPNPLMAALADAVGLASQLYAHPNHNHPLKTRRR